MHLYYEYHSAVTEWGRYPRFRSLGFRVWDLGFRAKFRG